VENVAREMEVEVSPEHEMQMKEERKRTLSTYEILIQFQE
jgi:hypothetical protein